MPSSHRRYAGWTIDRIRQGARAIGPATAALCELILEQRPHPEQGFRACLGIVRLAGPYGAERLEAAAERAIEIGARTYGSVKSISPTISIVVPRKKSAPRTERRSCTAVRATTIRRSHLAQSSDARPTARLGPLTAWPRPSPRQGLPGKRKDSIILNGWRSCSIARRRGAATSASPPDCATPNCASRPPSRTSTIAARVVSTARSSKSSLSANGLRPTTIWRSSARPASARAGWRRRSATRPAATIDRCFITACPSFSKNSPWPAATDAIRAFCVRSAAPICSFWTTGDWSRAAARHDLLEILEERYGRRSTVITSQLPVDRWHEIIGDPTYADAILDRLVHNAHRIELTGESMRRTRGEQNQKA
jgi:IstB-like ATP binding protein